MIEHEALKYLGIYPESVEKADVICERVCEKYGIGSDYDVWEHVRQDFEKQVYDEYPLSDLIIFFIFKNLKAALVKSKKVEEPDIDWYINGWDTGFYIDGEEQ